MSEELDKLPPSMARMIRWQNDPNNFVRPAPTKFDIINALQSIVQTNELDDRDYSRIMTLFMALVAIIYLRKQNVAARASRA